jgi:hypothetical protein
MYDHTGNRVPLIVHADGSLSRVVPDAPYIPTEYEKLHLLQDRVHRREQWITALVLTIGGLICVIGWLVEQL